MPGDLYGQFNGILIQRVDFIRCINLPFATHFDHEFFVQPVFHFYLFGKWEL